MAVGPAIASRGARFDGAGISNLVSAAASRSRSPVVTRRSAKSLLREACSPLNEGSRRPSGVRPKRPTSRKNRYCSTVRKRMGAVSAMRARARLPRPPPWEWWRPVASP